MKREGGGEPWFCPGGWPWWGLQREKMKAGWGLGWLHENVLQVAFEGCAMTETLMELA